MKTLVGRLEHKIDVMNHTIFDMDIATREKVTRNYDDLTRKYTMASLEVANINSRHSQPGIGIVGKKGFRLGL